MKKSVLVGLMMDFKSFYNLSHVTPRFFAKAEFAFVVRIGY
tara:strand:- start:416 stop:538 length:123 start_codon:yes stop_codon:yes gene_type:complete